MSFPSVSVVPPGVMVLAHVDSRHVVELELVPAPRSFLLQPLLPRIYKSYNTLVTPQHHHP